MATATRIVKANSKAARNAREQAIIKPWMKLNAGLRADMDVDDIAIDWLWEPPAKWTPAHRDRADPDLEIKGAILSAAIELNMIVSTITIVVADPYGAILKERMHRWRSAQTTKVDGSALIGNAAQIELTARDVAVGVVEREEPSGDTTLTFEPYIPNKLKRAGKGKPRNISRAKSTRAQAIRSMVREADEHIRFVCPEIQVEQRIAGQGTTASKTKRHRSAQPSVGLLDKNLTIKGVKATPEQRHVGQLVLESCYSHSDITIRAVDACVNACITESAMKNLTGGSGSSQGVLQVEADQHPGVDPRDVNEVVGLFVTKGFTGEGGAIKLSKQHTDWQVWKIAQHVQGSGAGLATDGRSNYGPWSAEAKTWREAFRGASPGATAGGGSYRKSYQYTRDKAETTWMAANRLAVEVEWSLFCLAQALVYVDEKLLLAQPTQMTLTPDSGCLVSMRYGSDWDQPANEVTATVLLGDGPDRWDVPPGLPVELNHFEVPDGRWLVDTVRRDWFSDQADVTLRKRIPEKPEPEAETGTRPDADSESDPGTETGNEGLDKLIRICSTFTNTYVWGGNHGPPLSKMSTSQGFDCSSSTSFALYKAGFWEVGPVKNAVLVARVSGPGVGRPNFSNWGKEGRGKLFTVWYSNDHVYIEFEDPDSAGWTRFDTSNGWGETGAQAEKGPRLRSKPRTHGTMRARHWPKM